jgi:hypothetical protein|tara:strand:+ start:34 stop:261 length:228 start_codon:yes stop_codon:yes gene_type:complete
MTLTLQYDDFMTYVHKLAKQPDSNYMDAVLDYAQKNDIEIEALGDIIRKNTNLKSRIQDEAEDLRLMERTAKLPV